MRKYNPFRGCITPGVIIGTIIFGSVMFLGVLLLLNWSRPPRTPTGVVTAALTVIPIPTETPTMTPTPVENLPNPDEPPAPPTGELVIGAYVKVTGTEGAGLRLRASPGLDYESLFLGVEDEIFEIKDGPQEADGYVWWYLIAPFETSRNGWAVSNFLEPIQEP